MKVLYRGNPVTCYAITCSKKDEKYFYVLSKKDTGRSGATTISEILKTFKEELIYIDPCITLDMDIKDDFVWIINPSEIQRLSNFSTNKDALFLLERGNIY